MLHFVSICMRLDTHKLFFSMVQSGIKTLGIFKANSSIYVINHQYISGIYANVNIFLLIEACLFFLFEEKKKKSGLIRFWY